MIGSRFVLAAWLLFATVSTHPSQAFAELKVVSWNMHYLADTLYEKLNPDAGVARTNSDLDAMRRIVARLQPDVVLAQEVENRDALESILGGNFDIWVGLQIETSTAKTPILAAVAVRKDLGARPIRLELMPRIEAVYVDSGGLQFLRGVAGASINIGTHSVHMLSVHIKSGCQNALFNMESFDIDCMMADFQLRQLVRWARAQGDSEGTPYVLGGDFNQNWGVDAEKTLSLRFRSNVKLIPDTGVSGCAQRPKRLDYFIVSSRLEVSSFEEHPLDEEALYYGAEISDHCPISIILNINQ